MANKFIFNLESLKKLRHHRLGIAKKEYMRLQSTVFRLEDQITQLKEQRGQTLGEINSLMTQTSSVNNMSFLIETIYCKIKELEEKIRDLGPDVERHRRWMVEASRELRAIEILEEKRRREFEFLEVKREKRKADQWASESHARKMVSDTNMAVGDSE